MKLIKYISTFLLIFAITSCSEDTVDSFGTGTITGTVVANGSNEPIENVRISTSPASTTEFTDENGEFILNDVPAGEYSIQARKEGLLTKFEGTTVSANRQVNVIFELDPENANNSQPNAPQAVFPEDNATGLGIEVEFAWTASDPEGDSLTYELEIRNDRNDEVLNFTNIADTTYTVSDLDYGFKYFWQIKASDSVNEPVLSPIFSFKTLEFPKSRKFYVRRIGENNVIFSRNENDVEYQLTSSNSNSFRPRKNTAINKIAFLRTIGGQTQLFTMDLDGSNQFQVTSTTPVNGFNLEKIDFSWADDGQALVYPNFNKLYKVNVSGGGTELLYQTPNGKFITEVDVSEDNELIALLTNNASGYDASIYTINTSGERLETVVSGEAGALGGLNLSVDKKRLLYSQDVSGFENPDYRRLDSRIFIYTFENKTTLNISSRKPDGTNDLDPRFSPDEAEVIFVNTSNDGVSQENIYKASINVNDTNERNRTLLYENAIMPDWE